MGNTQTNNQYQSQDLLTDFTQLRKQNNGLVLSDKKSQNTYFLKEFNFVNKKQYQQEFKRLQSVQSQPQNQNVLPLIRLFSQTFNNICSNSYKIYALYEYPSITLEEQVIARKKQNKYFDECELWSILQSCANALSQLRPVLSLHPRNVFIVPDGVLKVINNQMIDEDYRCYLKENVYYAPEKIRQFKKSDNQNLLRKQSIFSLGMTILHAALLEPLNDCYNYQNLQFHEDRLQKHIEDLVNFKSIEQSRRSQASQTGRYSQEFIQMLAMIVEPNPNKRASLMEVHGMLNKVWNTQTQQGNGQQEEEVQDPEKHNNQTANQSLKNTQKLSQRENNIQKSSSKAQIPRPSELDASVMSQNIPLNENLNKSKAATVAVNQSQTQNALHSYHQSQRQSKPNLNEVTNTNMPKQSFQKDPYIGTAVTQSIKSSVQYPTYPSYVPTNISYGPIYPSVGVPSFNKQNNLYTDPKLLEMIRKDLQDLNQLKKSSMMSAYGGYPGTYLGSSNYYTNSIGDYGTGGLYSSSRSSLTGFPLGTNTQQIYTVNTETAQITQRTQTCTAPISAQKAQTQQKTQQPKPVTSAPKIQASVTDKQRQPTFSKTAKNQIYVVEQYEDGRKFEGTMINGSKQGYGKLTYSDGAYYEGDFKDDRMEGEGTLYYGPDRPAYEGSWLADQFHGFGTLYNQSPIDLNGAFNYNDFNLIEDFWVRYQGNFDCDNKSGEGKLILSNGQQFHGTFENDLINGRGAFFTKEGQKIQGLWEDNILTQIDA